MQELNKISDLKNVVIQISNTKNPIENLKNGVQEIISVNENIKELRLTNLAGNNLTNLI